MPSSSIADVLLRTHFLFLAWTAWFALILSLAALYDGRVILDAHDDYWRCWWMLLALIFILLTGGQTKYEMCIISLRSGWLALIKVLTGESKVDAVAMMIVLAMLVGLLAQLDLL